MLCLTRYPGDVVLIDTRDGVIRLEVVEVRGQKVKLGLAAPPDVTIVREEILDRFPLEGDGRGPAGRGVVP